MLPVFLIDAFYVNIYKHWKMDSRNTGEKKYGLILPAKKGARLVSGFVPTTSSETKSKVFCNDSSDDDLERDDESEGNPLDWRSRTVAKAAEKSMQRNQARQAAIKALAEDPTIFQYDELYDDMEQNRVKQKPVKEEKKPKYIANLMRTAEDRKIENERRTERKVQKERELEGDQFQDKESFVTPAYRAKLAELKKAEEEEMQKERMEEFLDVTKQRDLSGFYRHLYRQTFSEKSEVAEGKKDEGESKPSSSRAESTSQKNEDQKVRRQYRQRREESPEAASVEPEKGKEVSEASDHESEGEEERKTETLKEMAERRPAASSALLAAAASDREALANRKTAEQVEVDAAVSSSSAKHDRSRTHKRRKEADSSESDSSRSSSPSPKKKKKEAKENVAPKVKIDIWKKRNTGEVLEAAIERYQLRREARENGLVPWP